MKVNFYIEELRRRYPDLFNFVSTFGIFNALKKSLNLIRFYTDPYDLIVVERTLNITDINLPIIEFLNPELFYDTDNNTYLVPSNVPNLSVNNFIAKYVPDYKVLYKQKFPYYVYSFNFSREDYITPGRYLVYIAGFQAPGSYVLKYTISVEISERNFYSENYIIPVDEKYFGVLDDLVLHYLATDYPQIQEVYKFNPDLLLARAIQTLKSVNQYVQGATQEVGTNATGGGE